MRHNALHVDKICHYQQVGRHLKIELDQSFAIYHRLDQLTTFDQSQMQFYRHPSLGLKGNQGVERMKFTEKMET